MDSIKFIYFDVGGVAILDYSGTNKWTEMKRALGISAKNDPHFDLIWKKYEKRICIDCDIDNLIPDLKQIEGTSIPDNYSMLNDFVERFERNPSILPVIDAAKKKYKIGLLTNLYPRMYGAINERGLMPDAEWDAIVDSSNVGYQKPQPEIYQKAEEMAGVKPEEIFFIENSQENAKQALERGWKTYLYNPQTPNESSTELISVLGL